MERNKGILTKRQKKQLLRLGSLLGLAFLIFCGVFSMQQKHQQENRELTVEELSSFMSFYEYNSAQWKEYFKEQGYGKRLSGREFYGFMYKLGVSEYVQLDGLKKDKIISYEEFLPVYEQLLSILDTDHQVNLKQMKVDGECCQVYCIGDKVLGFKSFVNKNMVSEAIAKENFPTDNELLCVLLKNGASYYRKTCYLKINSAYTKVTPEQKKKTVKKDTFFSFTKTGKVDSPKKKECITLIPKKKSGRVYITDKTGKPISKGYRGNIKIYRYSAGYVIVNELPVGEYLYGVLPSEMPSSYEKEALKAQAVCARSFAYRHMSQANGLKKFYAQIDDSTAFQVYNKSSETKSTTAAVDETRNMVLKYKGNIATTYYYSTSCGIRQSYEIWRLDENTAGYLQAGMIHKTKKKAKNLSSEKAFKAFIDKPGEGFYEKDYRFFRWKATASYKDKEDDINRVILARKKAAPGSVEFYNSKGKKVSSMEKFGKLKKLKISGRYKSGTISEMVVFYKKGSVHLKNEYTIRVTLAALSPSVTLQDNTTYENTLLPSACFYIKSQKNKKIMIAGGGYGHGLGLSQNGANELAKDGYSYKKILKFFYQDVTF